MSQNTPRKLITRGIPTKILNFDGPSFSLQITQGKLDAGLAKDMALEKRTKARHEKVEKSMKETRLPIWEKSKIHISEASSVKGKEVEAIKTSDKIEEKVAKDPSGKDINALEQHIKNLLCPSTPHFFNTLYDPYRENTDAMRKIDADVISENKAPSKIDRQITESDLKMQIVLE